MNERLALILQEVGKSPADLAKAVNRRLTGRGVPPLHRTTVNKWITEGSRPKPPVTDIVSAILTEWCGRDVSPGYLRWADRTTVPALGVLSEPWGAHAVLLRLRSELGDDVDRRVYLAQSGLALAALANPWLLDPTDQIAEAVAGRRISNATVSDINLITAARRRMDDALGGGTLLAAVREDLKVTIGLITRASYSIPTGKLLYSAFAEQARLASWLAWDSGAYGLAQHYTSTALRSAHAAEDRLIGANILGFAAYQAGAGGDTVAAEALSRAALANSRGALTPAVEGSLHARLGMARARIGDADGAARAFEEAESLLARSDPQSEPDWIYWFTNADKDGIAGESYLAGGDIDGALVHLRAAVDGTPEDLVRDAALWRSSLATAHATGGDLDEGRSVAEEALELLSGELESERVFSVFDGFCNALRAHDERTADEFHERLVAHAAEGDQV